MKKIKSKDRLIVTNLHVAIDNREIINGLNLRITQGEFHVVMGPNGSGKSTLTYALMGHPNYKIKDQRSKIKINQKIINDLSPDVRAKMGLMLAFQNPMSIPGVTLNNFLRTAYREKFGKEGMSVLELHKHIIKQAKILDLKEEFLKRGINDGFSGGEKKKAEMLQLLILQPKFAIFDEIDTGLDVDALKSVAQGIGFLQKTGCGILLITHYQRILNYVKPEIVHIMKQGKFVREGGIELVKFIEEKGYAEI